MGNDPWMLLVSCTTEVNTGDRWLCPPSLTRGGQKKPCFTWV